LGPVAVPLPIHCAGREITPDQVWCPPPSLALSGGVLAPLLRPGHQVLLTHDLCDGVLADPPAGLAQVVGDPRRSVLAVVSGEQLPDRRGQLRTPRMPRRAIPVAPLVEPRRAHPQRPARRGMRDLVFDPLSCDEPRHGYRLIASSTHYAERRVMPRMSVN